jgi:hypothetical protein
MRVSIYAATLCAVVTLGVVSDRAAAQSQTEVRVATATPAVSAAAPKFKFILFYKENNKATQTMADALKKAVEQRAQRAEWTSANITDITKRVLVERYHVERAPMPLVICVAPNGAVTAGITRQAITDELVENALVTPAMAEATKALQDKKIVVIQVKRDAQQAMPAGAADFMADPLFSARTTAVSVQIGDETESRFIREMEIKPEEVADSMIVVLAPPGVLVGKYPAGVTKDQIGDALHAAGKCCNDPNCKHNKKAQ